MPPWSSTEWAVGHLELSGPVFQSFLLLEILLPVCTFFWLSDLESSVSQTCLFPLERFYLSFNASHLLQVPLSWDLGSSLTSVF